MEGSDTTYITTMIEKLVVLGQQQIKKGNLRKAKTAFEYSYKKAKLVENTEYQETSLVNLAAVYISGEKPENALECLNAVLQFPHHKTNLGDVHHNMAIAHEMLNHVAEASKEYEFAFAAYTTTDTSSDVLSNVAVKIGMFFMKHGKSKKAVDYFNKAAGILSEKELIIQLATLLCLKSRCLMSSHETVPDAVQVCEESLKLCKSIEQDLLIVQVYNELGLILTQCKAFEMSSRCYKQALIVCDDLNYDSVTWEKKAALLQNLGAVLNSLGKFDESIKYSQQAADIYGTKGVRSSQCHCFLNIAFGYSQKKSDNFLEKCEEYYRHALQAAKDTGCLRDQWQSLEGLGGIAFSKGQSAKAADFYQKAIGICASLQSNNREQDRLVRKLSASLKMKLPPSGLASARPVQPVPSALSPQSAPSQSLGNQLPIGANVPQIANAQHSPLLVGLDLRGDSLIVQPHTELSYYRPANADARRENLAPDMYVETDSGSQTRTKKKRRKRVRRPSYSRRPDQEIHPIHGRHEMIHHGLGSYTPAGDETIMYHLSADDFAHKGQRRHHGDDASSIVPSRLHIQGLAVDDPSEPLVGASSQRGNYRDTLDSAEVVQVRPMSSKIRHRRSTIPHTGIDLDSSSEETSETLNTIDCYDECVDSLYREDEEISAADEEKRKNIQKYGDVFEANHSKMDASTVVENKEYDRTTPTSNRTKSAEKGKRPMSAKSLIRKSSQGFKRGAGDQTYQDDTLTKTGLLHTGSEDDREEVYAHMRKISNYDTTDSEEKLSVRSQEQNKKQGVHFESSSESDLESEQDQNVGTYEEPAAGLVPGGNFFKSTGGRSKQDPVYESIANASSTAPNYSAPPALPARNYSNADIDKEEPSQTSSSESVDVNAMTKGERDNFLFQKYHRNSEKVKKWKRKIEPPNQARKQNSEVCSLM